VRPPTEKQFVLLRMMAGGAVVVTPRRREWEPLLKRGWMEYAPGFGDPSEPPRRGSMRPLRITAAGLRAYADGVEAYGLPDVGVRMERSEPKLVRELREQRDEARQERDQAARENSSLKVRIARARRALEDPS
jgi:hypothetical protein